MTTILITGAAGTIGTLLTERLATSYKLVLNDIHPLVHASDQPMVSGDLAQIDVARRAVQGVDVVVHLAANANPTAPWGDLLGPNIVGAQNIFQAASEAGCRRVIFASSVHAVLGYPPQQQVRSHMSPRPPDLYGATKAWGEALAFYYAHAHGLSAICLRLGLVLNGDSPQIDPSNDEFDIILTYDDLVRLVTASVEAPATLRFGTFHGVSNNRWSRLDLSDARAALGYAPADDVFAIAAVRAGAAPLVANR